MATKYSDIVTIREARSAYNIKDEQSGDWMNFIANEQFNGILKKVIASVRNDDINLHKSFWISGTYGTGKSHAGAVIKHLLCDSVDDISTYINDEYADAKYEVLRNDIFKLREQKRLFPVMLYGQSSISHKDDLSLKLQLEITKALKDAGLSNIIVKTDFDNYVNHIESRVKFWDMLIDDNAQLKSVVPTRQKLISELKNGDTNTLGKVRDALRAGKYHIRLDNNNLAQWFFEVQKKLADETEYDGLLVIWDEFTDVMTSDIGLSLLVALQEIDEKIMNPENNSYFLYISHPSALNSLRDDEREKTKGRYHYMGYNMEPVSAFKIMSRKFKIIDESQMKNLTDNFYANKQDLLDVFSKTSTNPEETRNDIIKLFPLHPSTANLATYYAREAGSSSRSVFQFLGENDAIKQFLNDENHFSSKDAITADYLWDYVLVEFNANVVKFGAVTERFNSRKIQVEHQDPTHFAVFKSILLLNALNNIANNVTVTPSEENIRNLFVGTVVENELDNILNYFDEKGIIQRQPGELFSIQFTALPAKEIEDIKGEIERVQFKFTSQVANFGETAKNEIEKFLSNVARPNRFFLYSEDSNEYTLLNKIEQGYKQSKSYEVFMALLFAKNANELNIIKDIAERVSKEDRFQNVVFIVFESTFGDKNFERFIEYQANATCAQRHGFADQQKTHTECASKMIKEWMGEIRRSNFSYYIRGQKDINTTIKIASTINACISPVIFSNGPESLPIIQARFSNTFWKKASVKQTVDSILSFNDKTEISNRCAGQAVHVSFLLQDSVDENLKWKKDVDKNHPLYLVCQFIDKKFAHTDKNQPFNLGDKLIDLTKPPFGLFQSYAGMGMVAFAMKRYVQQIYDLNGKARQTQHIVEDIVEMFKVWEDDKTSGKLNFRFETQESKNLCAYFIRFFKLKDLTGYNDISSLTDARWAVTHEYSKEQGYPLWALKYSTSVDGVKTLIDNILKICSEADVRNPYLLNETITGFEKYEFEIGNLLLVDANNFKNGFVHYLQSIDIVNLQDDEVDEADKYIRQHLQGAIGLWTESEVEGVLKNWKIEDEERKRKEEEERKKKEEEERKRKEEENKNNKPDTFIGSDKQKAKKLSAINKVRQINDIQISKKLLEKICESGDEKILEIINNYDV
jgi:hypothetical protein